ncbi:MAG: hypothetical protein K2L41_04310 [Muribaculaceae bacterium]|nr:hypothetical protein [Muribaculaceae bacterium]
MRGFMLMMAAVVVYGGMAQDVDRSMATMTPEEISQAEMKQGHKIVFVGDGEQAHEDSVMRMINMYYIDQFRHFKDPQAPYFLLMSKDANLSMGVGGAVRMRGWADFDGSIPANGFCPYLIPVPANPELRRRIGGTPAGTSLFFQVIGFNTVVKDFNAYIQCDFSGPENVGFKLKKAYVTIQDWTVGYATTTFSDPSAETPTLDGAGPNGKASRAAMLVRWMHSFSPRWSMAASVEMPSSRIDADGVGTKALADWMPDYVVFGQYGWSHDQHVRLSGLLKVIPYRDLVAGVNRNVVGWAVQASAVVRPVNRLALYGILNAGRGYCSYVGDLSIGNYDLVSTGDDPGRMHAPMALGLSAGMKYNFRYNVYSCVAYGQARYFNSHSDLIPSDYKRGHYLAVNLFWEMTPRLQVGVEYLWGQRTDFDGSHNHANRMDALFQFAF